MAVEQTIADFFPEITSEEASGPLDNETLIIAERRGRAASLYCRNKSMRDIAAELKCGLGTVHRDLTAVFEGWRRLAIKSAGEHIAQALARLADREKDIEREWERSKGPSIEMSMEEGDGGKGNRSRMTEKEKYGDPRLAALLLSCWDRRCKLLGLLKQVEIRAFTKNAVVVEVELGPDQVTPPPE